MDQRGAKSAPAGTLNKVARTDAIKTFYCQIACIKAYQWAIVYKVLCFSVFLFFGVLSG